VPRPRRVSATAFPPLAHQWRTRTHLWILHCHLCSSPSSNTNSDGRFLCICFLWSTTAISNTGNEEKLNLGEEKECLVTKQVMAREVVSRPPRASRHPVTMQIATTEIFWFHDTSHFRFTLPAFHLTFFGLAGRLELSPAPTFHSRPPEPCPRAAYARQRNNWTCRIFFRVTRHLQSLVVYDRSVANSTIKGLFRSRNTSLLFLLPGFSYTFYESVHCPKV
jgi:hypothetical protein